MEDSKLFENRSSIPDSKTKINLLKLTTNIKNTYVFNISLKSVSPFLKDLPEKLKKNKGAKVLILRSEKEEKFSSISSQYCDGASIFLHQDNI